MGRPKTSKRSGPQPITSMSIAVLDPNFSGVELLCRRIRLAGHHCHRFRSGHTLIRALDKHFFDGFIVEWELPDISASEMLKRIRAKYQWSAAVLIASVCASEDSAVNGLQQGADGYMVKPLRLRESIARLECILVRARKRQENPGRLPTRAAEI